MTEYSGRHWNIKNFAPERRNFLDEVIAAIKQKRYYCPNQADVLLLPQSSRSVITAPIKRQSLAKRFKRKIRSSAKSAW